MVKDSFYPDYGTDHGLVYTNDLNTIGAAIPLDNPSADPSKPYFMGYVNTSDIPGFVPQELKVEIDSNDGRNSTIGCYEIESLKTVNWGYFYGMLEGMQSYYDTNRGWYVGAIKYVNSAEVYKWTINNANIVIHVTAGTFTDVTLDTGDTIKHTANDTSYGAAINISFDNFIKWHKGEYTPTVTLNGNSYNLQWNSVYSDRFWVFSDFYIWIDSVTVPHYGYYNGGSGYYLNPFISLPLHHPTLDTTVYKVWCCPDRTYFSSPPNRIHFNTALTDITLTNVTYHQYPADNYTQGQVVTGFLPFETKGAVLDWQRRNPNYGKLVMYNNGIFRWLGGSDPDWQVASMPILRLNSIWTIFCLNNKYALDNTGNQAIDYNPHTSVSMFWGDNKPKSVNEQVTTYPQIEPQLQDWQKYDHKIEENNYPVNSPLFLSLWSIKETKDDIKVANVFPYNHDAGDGTFFAQVRSKIKYDTLTRDENSEVIINGLKFEFEDAVRKSSWRDGAEEPEPYLLATYNFGQINSANFNSGENVISKGEIQIENFPSELDRIIDLKNNELIQGSYLGEVISYFNVANTQYQVNLNVLWKYKPGEQPWNGKEIIRVRRKDGTGIPEEREVRMNDANSPAPFVLEPYDDNGNLINYIIECQIFDEQQHLDDDWSIYVDTYEINYEDRRNIINIFNSWNKINYEIDQLSNTITLDIKFNTKDFVNPFDFISYMKGTYTSVGKNPVHDWENIINKSGYLSAINDNQIGFFCAKYTYTWGNEGECFTILPYLTIVIKNQNNTSINTFEINAKEQEGVFNPLARDMNKNSIWNDENLDWPYYSKRNYDSQGNYQLGAESTKLFGRKGFYKISEQEDKKWTNADDTDFIADYYENNIGELHIGEPSENSHNEYEIINNDFVYSIIKMDEVNQIPYLYNFCIFIIDNNTSDAQDVRDIIPYYYCASITEPIRANKPGKITATIYFNEKSNNYWNMSAPTTGGQYIQNYLTHKAHKPFDECIYSVMISGENPIIYSVNKPVLLQAAISMPDIPNNWLETKYPIYN